MERDDDNRSAIVQRFVSEGIARYSRLQRMTRWGFRVFNSIQIVLASLIPLAALFLRQQPQVAADVAAVFGAIIAIVKGLDSLYQTRESYVRYAQTALRLYIELEKYRLRAGDYKNAIDPEGLLMLRSIEIRREENDVWAASTIKPETKQPLATSP